MKHEVQTIQVKLMPLITVSLLIIFGWSMSAAAFDLVLDPGHSPKSPGAMSCSGIPEYRFNNALVSFIAESLGTKPDVKVRLSKACDAEINIHCRVKHTKGRNLFISVHHDSVQPRYLTYGAKDGGKPACSDKASGFSIFVSRKNPYYHDSLVFARRLGKSLVAQGLHPSLHHAEPIPGENRPLLDRELGVYAFDDLVVLKEAGSPAILLEAGVIVNPVDEKTVTQEEFKKKVANAVTAAIAGDSGVR